jgi:hypothetical protein
LTFVLAYVTYVFVQQTFRGRSAFKIFRTVVFNGSAAGPVAFAGVSLAGHFAQGFSARNPDFLRLQQNFRVSSVCSGALDAMACKTNREPKIILWGDSHAMHLAQACATSFPRKASGRRRFPAVRPCRDTRMPSARPSPRPWNSTRM